MSDSGSSDVLAETRRSLHRVAEHVLSAARKRETHREITLLPGSRGVRTPPLADGRELALIEVDIAVVKDGTARREPLTTVRAAAEFVGIEPGFPWTKHPPGTELMPDEPLHVDLHAARLLADWFALGDSALRALAASLTPGQAATPQIYPEHFDLAVTLDEVNYGASPGDADIATPYLYIGPFAGPPETGDPFWNAAFGAYLARDAVDSVDDALAFFVEGQRRLAVTSR